MDVINENLRRAQQAINRARSLSLALSTLALAESDDDSDTPVPVARASAEATPSAELARGASGEAGGSSSSPGAGGALPPPSREPTQLHPHRIGPDREAGPASSSGDDAESGAPACTTGYQRQRRQGQEQGQELGPGEEGGEPAGEGQEGDDDADAADAASDEERRASGCCAEGRSVLSEPVLQVAQQLASLQRKQAETLQQLLVLRLQQLKLRQQQLTALQELLVAEMALVEGTPMQVSAVEQAVALLSQSLRDMNTASRALLFSKAEDMQSVSAAVSATDTRADEVSRMARQLLSVLRAFPRRRGLSAHDTTPGASSEAIASIPTTSCSASSPLLGETCCICLGSFAEGDQLKAIACAHYHHGACLDEWLRIRGCCPLCKVAL